MSTREKIFDIVSHHLANVLVPLVLDYFSYKLFSRKSIQEIDIELPETDFICSKARYLSKDGRFLFVQNMEGIGITFFWYDLAKLKIHTVANSRLCYLVNGYMFDTYTRTPPHITCYRKFSDEDIINDRYIKDTKDTKETKKEYFVAGGWTHFYMQEGVLGRWITPKYFDDWSLTKNQQSYKTKVIWQSLLSEQNTIIPFQTQTFPLKSSQSKSFFLLLDETCLHMFSIQKNTLAKHEQLNFQPFIQLFHPQAIYGRHQWPLRSHYYVNFENFAVLDQTDIIILIASCYKQHGRFASPPAPDVEWNLNHQNSIMGLKDKPCFRMAFFLLDLETKSLIDYCFHPLENDYHSTCFVRRGVDNVLNLQKFSLFSNPKTTTIE